ncbi:MAG: hypothetical protein RMJ84_13380 [Sandaracinaceae bacterium]|nr:hypothetical protein [Sandaracinaceae bacterium]
MDGKSLSHAHYRMDRWTGLPVLVAPSRGAMKAPPWGGLPPLEGPCPFCPGNENACEATTQWLGDPWRVRAVLNRYPLVHPAGLPIEGSTFETALGVHEVIVEHREHSMDITQMRPDECFEVLWMWRARMRALEKLKGVRSLILFKNRGLRAGSSQPHPHSQLVALHAVPPAIAARSLQARHRGQLQGGAFVRALCAEELAHPERLVLERGSLWAFCPWASPKAFWLRIAFDQSAGRFSELPDQALWTLAGSIGPLLRSILMAAQTQDFNLFILDPPLNESYGFSIEVVPRTSLDAGFELASGLAVCTCPPEQAAPAIREALRMVT